MSGMLPFLDFYCLTYLRSLELTHSITFVQTMLPLLSKLFANHHNICYKVFNVSTTGFKVTVLVSAYTAGKIYNSHKKLMLETDLQTTTVSRSYLSGTKIYLINKQTNAVYLLAFAFSMRN